MRSVQLKKLYNRTVSKSSQKYKIKHFGSKYVKITVRTQAKNNIQKPAIRSTDFKYTHPNYQCASSIKILVHITVDKIRKNYQKTHSAPTKSTNLCAFQSKEAHAKNQLKIKVFKNQK